MAGSNRSCPECGYRYRFSEYVRGLSYRVRGYNWQCPSCRAHLSYHSGKRIFLIIPIVLVMLIYAFLLWTIDMSDWLKYLVLPLILLALVIAWMGFLRSGKNRENQKHS